MLVHELHGHRAFADGRRAALRRARADVARGEDAGDARLEQVGGSGRVAGDDEAVVVACNGVAEPVRARLRAEEEEQERERHEASVGERHRLEASVAAVERCDLAAVTDSDAVALQLSDEVVRHRLAQVAAAVQERDERATAREPDRSLAGGVSATDYGDA